MFFQYITTSSTNIHLKIVSVSIIVNKFSTSFIYSGLERIKQINTSFQNKHVDKSVVSLN